MSVRGAVDAVVVTFTMLAAMGAAFVVVALVLPLLTVVTDLLPVVVTVGAAVVAVGNAVVAETAVDEVVVSATVVVVSSAAGFLLPPPPQAAATIAPASPTPTNDNGRDKRPDRPVRNVSPPLGARRRRVFATITPIHDLEQVA